MSTEASVLHSLKLILVGMSGVGKSAAGNTILGREEFISEASSSSLTLKSKKGEGEMCGRRVLVVDTPGLCNTELSEKNLREEIQRALNLCDLSPHAVLLVIQLGRLTQQERTVMKTLQELFKKENLHIMVLFTYGDRLRNKTIQEFIDSDTNLQQLIEECGNRYHVFNNQQMEDHSQVSELLQKIDNMVATEKKTLDEGGNKQLEELRILLVGKTGVGNRAARNTILGTWESGISSSSVTAKWEVRGKVKGRDVSVIETPGLFDAELNNDRIVDEIIQCISQCSSGPHVFLVVIQIDRFTPEDQETVEIIQKTFGAKSSKFTMVLFTHEDTLEKTAEDFLSKNKKLADFTDKCRGGYHVFNNQDTNHSQVSKLLKKINKMVAINGGGCYTNEMYEMAEKMKRKAGKEAEKCNKDMRRQMETYVGSGCTIL